MQNEWRCLGTDSLHHSVLSGDDIYSNLHVVELSCSVELSTRPRNKKWQDQNGQTANNEDYMSWKLPLTKQKK